MVKNFFSIFSRSGIKTFLFAVAVIFLLPFSVNATEEKIASVIFEENPIMENVTSWNVAESDAYDFINVFGKTGLIRTPQSQNFVCIDIDDSYWYGTRGEAVSVTVEYFDMGNGKFSLRYNSPAGGVVSTPDDIVYLNNSYQWKKHIFYLDDCILNNSLLHSSDMIVALWTPVMGLSDGNVIIRSVMVNAEFPQNPVSITATSENIGNIFGKNDNPRINLSVENRTEYSFTTSLNYRIKNSKNELISEGCVTLDLAEFEIKQHSIYTFIERYDLYYIEIEAVSKAHISGEEKSFEYNTVLGFSKALTTEENEPKNTYFNFVTHLSRYAQNESIDVISKSGAGGIRDEYYWSEAETVKGEYVISEAFKERVDNLSENNLDCLQILAYSNPLYVTDNYNIVNVPYTEEEIEGFANYAGFMAKELKGKIEKFEIWNEWNIKAFNTEERDADAYVRLLKASYEAIKAENPNAKVYGCATAGADVDFIRDVFECDGDLYMDALSIHPYDWSGGFDQVKFHENIQKVYDLMNEYNVNLPVVFSEIGWTTANCDTGVSEKEQAESAVKVGFYSKANGLADEIYWYDFQDDGANINDQESNFGVTTYQYAKNALSAKPSYLAISAMNSFMSRTTGILGKIENEEKGLYAYSFDTSEDYKVAVMWTNTELTDKVHLNLGCREIEVYDYFGNKINTLNRESGKYVIEVSAEPVYIIGDFDSFSETGKEIDLKFGIEIWTDTENGTVAFSGTDTGLNEGDILTVMLLKKEMTDGAVDKEDIVYIDDIVCESNGFNHKFKMPEKSYGVYKLYLSSAEAEKADKHTLGYNVIGATNFEIKKDNELYHLSVMLKNNNENDESAVIIVSQYNEENVLISAEIKEITIEGNTLNDFAYGLSVEKNASTAYCRAYLWDDFIGMYPLHKFIEG